LQPLLAELDVVLQVVAAAESDLGNNAPAFAQQRLMEAKPKILKLTSDLSNLFVDEARPQLAESAASDVCSAHQSLAHASASLDSLLPLLHEVEPAPVQQAPATDAAAHEEEEEVKQADDRVKTHLAAVGAVFHNVGGLKGLTVGHTLTGYPPGLYVAMRSRLHRAEEALFYLAPQAELIARGEYDLQCLEDSDIDSSIALKQQINAALAYLRNNPDSATPKDPTNAGS
jgi:hypothetical protein